MCTARLRRLEFQQDVKNIFFHANGSRPPAHPNSAEYLFKRTYLTGIEATETVCSESMRGKVSHGIASILQNVLARKVR